MQCSKGFALGFVAPWQLLNTSQEKGQALQWDWQSPPAHVHQALNALGREKDQGIFSFHSDVLNQTLHQSCHLHGVQYPFHMFINHKATFQTGRPVTLG